MTREDKDWLDARGAAIGGKVVMIVGTVLAFPGVFLAFRAATAAQVGQGLLVAAGSLMVVGARLRRSARERLRERRQQQLEGGMAPEFVTPVSGERAAVRRDWWAE